MRVFPLCLLPIAVLFASCAGKSTYQDSTGRASSSPDYSYSYAPGATTAAQAPAGAPAPLPQGPEAEWPKVFNASNGTNIIYQTQIDSWDGSAITGRNAVAVHPAGLPSAVYGLITFRATTTVDRGAGQVSLLNLQVTGAEFPSAPDKTEEFKRSLAEQYEKGTQTISLTALENNVAANEAKSKAAAEPIKNDPPKIIFSEKPAILVLVDGEPALRVVEGTDLRRVINTRALLLKDKQGAFFLKILDGYMSAPTLDANWKVAVAPPGAATAEQQARTTGGELDLLDEVTGGGTNEVVSLKSGEPPAVFISTTPAELIVFAGPPQYVPIPDTHLLYVTNTTGNVFKLLTDQSNYALLAGRWYQAAAFEGPWNFVPGESLPRDFANIPDSSPKENVKASVPGTPQAREALIANSIPQTAAVQRDSQMADPQIDGEPELAPISGTPLHYVANSATPIIRVDEKSWFACQNGKWFVATSAQGPWSLAESVPAVIYSIPPSSPMHYITYVRVYDSSQEAISYGYTPGYLGTVVQNDAVVVYGTGYYYRPWVGSVWYGYPYTWGLGVAPFWSPWTSWSYGFGFGWYSGFYYPYYHHHYHYWACQPPYPWWGPYRYYSSRYVHGRVPAHGVRGWANTSANFYRPPARVATTRRFGSPRPLPAYGSSYNSRTGTAVAGEPAQVQNVFRTSPRSIPAFRSAPGSSAENNRSYVRNPEGQGGWQRVRPTTRPETVSPNTRSSLPGRSAVTPPSSVQREPVQRERVYTPPTRTYDRGGGRSEWQERQPAAGWPSSRGSIRGSEGSGRSGRGR